MSTRLPARVPIIAYLAILLIGATGGTALAATTVSDVEVDGMPDGGGRLSVDFTGGPAPKYTVTGAGTTETSIVFFGATLESTIPTSLDGEGPIQSVTVSQVGGNVAIAVHLSSAVPVTKVLPTPIFIAFEWSPGTTPAPTPAPATDEGVVPAAASPASAGLGPVTKVVQLKYADVSEIAGVLVQGANVPSNDDFNPQTSNFGSQSFGGASNGITPAFQQSQQGGAFGGQFGGGAAQALGQRINDNLAIDRRLNAVILTGTPEVVAKLTAVIDKLDVPLDSVLLETQIVELDENGAKDLGIDFNAQGVVAKATYTTQTGQFASGNATFESNLYALITKGEGKILAKPRILAQNGAPASILTGDALPIITTVIVAGTSAVTSQQVNYVNVGVNLQIQPRISSDGFVTSHVFSEVSSVTAYTQGIPQISQRQAQTTATVKDGDSFVVGGLLLDNEVRTVYKVPYLGDVPLIGGLFKRLSSTSQRTNLYIVVTPRIVPRHSGQSHEPAPH
jgi:general secretion pathway protein D